MAAVFSSVSVRTHLQTFIRCYQVVGSSKDVGPVAEYHSQSCAAGVLEVNFDHLHAVRLSEIYLPNSFSFVLLMTQKNDMQVLTWAPPEEAELKQKVVRWTIAMVFALKAHLRRKRDMTTDLAVSSFV